MMRRIVLLLVVIAAFGTLSMTDASAQRPTAAPKKYQGIPEGRSRYGFVKPPHDPGHIKPVPGLLMAPAASWDWRTMGGVTSVKDQGYFGTCWLFAALGDLESKVLIRELASCDYSELNIQACNPVSTDCDWGGHAWMSNNYLSLLGSVDESCDPYPGGCPYPPCVNPACAFRKQVTEWRWIPNDVTSIKSAVQTYGPVSTSIYSGFPGFDWYDGSSCLTYTGGEETDHMVLIVGFDDALCGGSGAWIAKNSWGTSWGDDGYFYIRYGDARIGEFTTVITGYRPYDPNMKVYYYDEWGWWSSYGFGDGRDYAVVEIIPRPGDNGLYAVHFWATSGPTTCTIDLYDTFDGSSMPTNSLLGARPRPVTVNEAGYYTITFDPPVVVNAGDAVYIYADLNTGSWLDPVPFDDEGPMEANRSFISDDRSVFYAFDAGDLGMGDIGLRATLGPYVIPEPEPVCFMDGDPGFYVGFPAGVQYVIPGETWSYRLGPANFGFVSPACPDADTFCVSVTDWYEWEIAGDPALETPVVLAPGDLWWQDVYVTVPYEDVTVGQIDTVTAVMAYTDTSGLCAPRCGDCVDPNLYGDIERYSTTTVVLAVIESPPALNILQDSLYFVEQGQTLAYIPFSICNGDPYGPPIDYGYLITSRGHIGPAISQGGVVTGVSGGECEDVYGFIDAGTANVCDFDTLTIIAWNEADFLYDTCVQLIHVITPVPVPLSTAPVLAVLAVAAILAAAVLLRRATAPGD